MQIRLDDIAVFIANWNNKAENIQKIAEILNIGLESMVFIDDTAAERELVSSILPTVSVPDMPVEPERYIRAIDENRYFEMVACSQEDKSRNQMYRSNVQRQSFKRSSTDLAGFLKGLEMQTFAREFDEIHLPRISQLINKSNQFHLTTTRYTEAQIRAMGKDENII